MNESTSIFDRTEEAVSAPPISFRPADRCEDGCEHHGHAGEDSLSDHSESRRRDKRPHRLDYRKLSAAYSSLFGYLIRLFQVGNCILYLSVRRTHQIFNSSFRDPTIRSLVAAVFGFCSFMMVYSHLAVPNIDCSCFPRVVQGQTGKEEPERSERPELQDLREEQGHMEA